MRISEAIVAALERILAPQSDREAPLLNAAEPGDVIEPRVLLIVYDPIVDDTTGEQLSTRMGWHRVEDLVVNYISDLAECSGGYLRYQVVERIEVAGFPPKADGFRYDPASYLAVMTGRQAPHDPDLIDYHRILNEFAVPQRIADGELDELWVFAFPYAGLYESRMAGPGAFWCNAPVLEGTAVCQRRFVIMGFSYERGVGEMLENFGHRAESILKEVFKRQPAERNLFAHFTRYDKIAPGRAAVGTVHFAPNSERDYDWGNRRYVLSSCDDWYAFPTLQGTLRSVNCSEWGNGDIRLHHKWWLSHLPRVSGETYGVANNWWSYIVDPNRM